MERLRPSLPTALPESSYGLALPDRDVLSLAAAVREHEARTRALVLGPRPYDGALYRRLRQIRAGAPRPLDPFLALADAVRAHEKATDHRAIPRRPADHALYRHLLEVEWARAPLGPLERAA